MKLDLGPRVPDNFKSGRPSCKVCKNGQSRDLGSLIHSLVNGNKCQFTSGLSVYVASKLYTSNSINFPLSAPWQTS